MTKRSRKSAKDRKLEIVTTAIRLAADFGPDRLTTQKLAAEIGITQPAIFRHFPTKNDIWLAVAEHIGASMKVGTAIDPSLPSRALLQAMVLNQLRFIQKTPAIPAILFSRELHAGNEELRQHFAALMADRHQGLTNLMAKEIAAGGFDTDLIAEDGAYILLALIQGLAMRWSLSGRSFDLVDEGQRLLELQFKAFR